MNFHFTVHIYINRSSLTYWLYRYWYAFRPITLRAFCSALCIIMPRPGGIKRWCCLTPDSVCLTSDVCRVHPVGRRRVRPAGWMARIGWSGPARPAWLKAAAARFRCRHGWGYIVAAVRLQLVILALCCENLSKYSCWWWLWWLWRRLSDGNSNSHER